MKAIAIALSAFLACAAPAAAAATQVAPEALVKSTVDDVLAAMKQHRDRQAMRQVAEQKVVPHFDFRQMTQSAVGRSWSQASPAQQQALEAAFRTLLVNVYSQSLSREGGGNAVVDVKPSRARADENGVTVKTVVREGSRPPIPIDYLMAKTPAGWKVADVMVENVSLVATYRGSFADEIARGGIDGLLKALEEKNRGLAKG